MISLSYFLIAWIVLLGIFGIMMLLTLVQMLRHGLPSPSTYITTFVFLVVTAGVIIGSGLYFTGVDWTITINVIPTEILPIFPTAT